jgi:hypothetical protein
MPPTLSYAVTVISPLGYRHTAAFHEVAQTLVHGLTDLGHDAVLTTSGQLPNRIHIVLGSNLLPTYPLPLADDAILYNFEQVDSASRWFCPELLALFRRHTLWDYSTTNARALADLGVPVSRVVPLGYAAPLTRIRFAAVRDIDVLFFGSLNPRRLTIIRQMRDVGLRVCAVCGLYGRQRDALISRAKVILNVHYYEAGILEMVRLADLLANRCAVLSELGADPIEDQALAGGVAFASYSQLVQRARALVGDAEACERLASRGFELMRDRPIATILRQALAPL